ncbi:MAG: hypothetical protein RMK89_11965, partial [Armatimonadota bacterium]|nr:hypothetical protein [Armatimonadota bacterium]MDW8144165.1 hypothetical protein [Armatimonadota bacterium]
GWKLWVLLACLAVLRCAGWQQEEEISQPFAATSVVLPLLPGSPVLDGKTNEPVWEYASSFILCDKPQIQVRTGFHGKGFWFALEGKNIPPDSRIVFAFRFTEIYDCIDEFTLFADGKKQLRRFRLSPLPSQNGWQAIAARTNGQWSAEVFVPFAALGFEDVRRGDVFLLEVRWEAGGKERSKLLHCYFGQINLLSSPDLSDKSRWSFSGADAPLYESVLEQGKRVIRIKSPGRYSTMSQSLRLQPNALYRLEAGVKGDAVIYLRARTAKRRGEPTEAYTVWTRPSNEYHRYSVRFPTGETGEALIIVGTTESSGKGNAFVRDLTVAKEVQFESFGRRIAVQANGAPVIAEKVLVEDCRALRGFIISPIDGRLDSVRWDGGVWEYNMPGAGAGVGYHYRNNDGLHVTLADANGVDAILVRGGARCKVYTDVKRYDDPNSGRLIAALTGLAQVERLSFASRIPSKSFSFFEVRDGLLADVTFLRVHRNPKRLKELGKPTRWFTTEPVQPPGEIALNLQRKFAESESRVYSVSPLGRPTEITLAPKQTVHLVSEPLPKETAITAISLEATVKFSGTICPLTIIVHDPLNPRIELMRSDFTIHGSGRIQIVMDFPDQVLPEQKRVWILVSSLGNLVLDGASVTMFTVQRERATLQALSFRKLIMRGLFSALSEARPWTGLYRGVNVEEWLKKQGAYETHLRELFETIDQCKWLCGTNSVGGVQTAKDPLVRQYDEWVFRYHRALPPFTPTIDKIPDAPEWAIVVRQAWLTAREVAKWWLDNRLVPTGEFGGEINDDTDMYQNYADLPMFEDGEFAQRLKDAARRLMVLAEQTTLEQGINRRTMDPLHAYEEGLNQEALLLWWDYGDPVAFERCLVATRSLQALTIVTPKGHRHFKSQSLGAEDLSIDRPTDVDGHAHPLMLHPAFEVAWYSGNPTVMKFLREWADGWLEHMKPGEYATSVEVATEKVVATTDTPIYGGYGSLGSAMAFMFWLTGDERYIEPFMHMWWRGIDRTSPSNLLPEMFHRGALDKLDRKTLLKLVQGRGVAEWLVTGDKRPLIEALKRDIAELQRFWDMYTTAEPFTDRVFLYSLTNPSIAYTGGYATRNKFNHTHAVSWEGFGTDFAALVKLARPKQLKVLVYNFAPKPIFGRMRVWTVEPGRYKVRVGVDRNGDDEIDTILTTSEVELQRGEKIELTLPPKQIAVVEAEQIAAMPPLFPRPDLAISAQEVRVEGNWLVVPVHNIGSADAPKTTILLRDRTGRGVIKAEVPALKAPLDLQPKVHIARLLLPPTALKPLQVIVDPENLIAEIYEGNNFVVVQNSL